MHSSIFSCMAHYCVEFINESFRIYSIALECKFNQENGKKSYELHDEYNSKSMNHQKQNYKAEFEL